LKGRRADVERQIEMRRATIQVRHNGVDETGELPPRLLVDPRGIELAAEIGLEFPRIVAEHYPADAALCCGNEQAPQ